MTSFCGRFVLDRALSAEHHAYLRRFIETPRSVWDEALIQDYPDPLREAVGLPIGLQGMYFTGAEAYDGLSIFEDPTIEAGETIDIGLVSRRICPYFSLYFASFEPGYSEEEMKQNYPLLFELASGKCSWLVTEDGMGFEWDEGIEKFEGAVGWLRFLLSHFLLRWNYTLSGEVLYKHDEGGQGRISIDQEQVREVCDRESLLPRPQEDLGAVPMIKDYWIVVSRVTDEAREALRLAQCVVEDYDDAVSVVVVKLSYNANAYRTDGEDDLRIFLFGELMLWSKELELSWSTPPGADERGIMGAIISTGWPEIEDLPEVAPGVYWMAVGLVTTAAYETLRTAGCVVRPLRHDPAIFLVGLSYEVDYHHTHGKDDFQHKGDVITIQSKNLHLFWKGGREMPLPMQSVTETTLMLASEQEGW